MSTVPGDLGSQWISKVNGHRAEIIAVLNPEGQRTMRAFNGCVIVLQHEGSADGSPGRVTNLEYRSLRRNYQMAPQKPTTEEN